MVFHVILVIVLATYIMVGGGDDECKICAKSRHVIGPCVVVVAIVIG